MSNNLIPAVGTKTAPIVDYNNPAIVAGFGMSDARISNLTANNQLPPAIVPAMGGDQGSMQIDMAKKIVMGLAVIGVAWYLLKA